MTQTKSATDAIETRNPHPALRSFQASGLAYVRFALRSPEHMLVMFDWPLAPDRYPELSAASTRAFSVGWLLSWKPRSAREACQGAIRWHSRA